MQDVQIAVLNKAIKLLDVLDLKYILVPKDGAPVIKGDLQLAKPPGKKTRRKRRPSGTFSNFFKEAGVNQLQPGDVAVLSIGSFDKRELQSALGAYANTLWGAGSYTTHCTNKEMQIMRIE